MWRHGMETLSALLVFSERSWWILSQRVSNPGFNISVQQTVPLSVIWDDMIVMVAVILHETGQITQTH